MRLRTDVLEFSRALRREIHVLADRPELTWQQLHNRLQWVGAEVGASVARERERRITSGRPWMRTRIQPGDADAFLGLLAPLHRSGLTIAPDSDNIIEGRCAFAPDGSFAVSASPLTIWDPRGFVRAICACREDEDGAVLVWGPDWTLRAVYRGHADAVSAFAVAPDGSYIVSASEDRTLRIWEPDGTTRAVCRGHENAVSTCAVAPDGSYIVSASLRDLMLRVWTPDGTQRAVCRGHTEWSPMHVPSGTGVTACVIAPDGSYIVSASDDRTLRIWEPDGEERAICKGHGIEFDGQRRIPTAPDLPVGRVKACVIAPDGSYIVSAGDDRTLRIWEPDGTERAVCRGHEDAVNACAIAPDGSYVVSASDDRTVRLWEPDGTETAVLPGHGREVIFCAVAPDGSYIVSASVDGSARLWEPDGAGSDVRSAHKDTVTACAIAPDGSFVVSAGADWTLQIWEPDGTTRAHSQFSLPFHEGGVLTCAIAPDSSFFVSGSAEPPCWVRIHEPDGTERAVSLGEHQHDVIACAIAPDSSYIVSASHSDLGVWGPYGSKRAVCKGYVLGAIAPDSSFIVLRSWVYRNVHPMLIWDRNGTELGVCKGHEDVVTACAIAPDASFIVSASKDRTLRIWDPDGSKRAVCKGHKDVVTACAIAPDASFVVSASKDRTLQIWDPDGSKRAICRGHEDAVTACAIAPNGAYFVSTSDDRTLRAWEPDGTERAVCNGHEDVVTACAIAPDSSFVVSASKDGMLRVWKEDEGPGPVAMIPLPAGLTCLALHPTEHLAVCGDEAGGVQILELLRLE